MGPCKVCVEKSDQIREILRPFQLEHVDPVGGVRIIGKSLAEARAQVAALTAERDAAAQVFAEHIKAVGLWLSEMYAIMVDPLADGIGTVAETCDKLKAAALKDRDAIHEKDAYIARLEAELAAAKQERDAFGAAVDAVNALTPLASRIGPLHGAGIADGFRVAKDAMRVAMLAARAPEGSEGKDDDGEA